MNQDPTPLINILYEEIHANDAHNPIGAIKTIISGKRGVGVVNLNKDISKKLEKYHIKIIPIRMTSPNTIMSIIYRDEDKAFKLYDIAKKKNGYLSDRTPDEAREIGRLLGYDEKNIEEYIHRKYDKKPPIMLNPKDVDIDKLDIDEQTIKDFEKQIEKDERTGKLDKLLLYEKDDYTVYAVNGNSIRRNGFDEWVDGGHHYVDLKDPKEEQKYAKFIPEPDIWIDDVFIIKPDDLGAILLHESLERHLMKFYGYVYSNTDKNPGAHEIANMAEVEYRKTSKKGEIDYETIQKIFDKFVKEWGNKKHKEKLNESYQFNKMKDLMKRII
jgi:nucleoside-triphosphatase THEP1